MRKRLVGDEERARARGAAREGSRASEKEFDDGECFDVWAGIQPIEGVSRTQSGTTLAVIILRFFDEREAKAYARRHNVDTISKVTREARVRLNVKRKKERST